MGVMLSEQHDGVNHNSFKRQCLHEIDSRMK